ncbi:MAG: hypothetical protein SO016_13395 [Lachnospiraceae bacterium]|nr:hypothetical protein [Robinsoniella sp.]MDY3767660.1 hypothetical protein [Lachnospiraceae bacterium]
MEWYPQLYVGKQVSKKRKQIVWKIRHHKKVYDVYLITLASNGKDMFDIFLAGYFSFPALERNCPLIVGIAGSHFEAVNLAVTIVEEVYRKTGNADARTYLEEMMEQYRQERKRQV